MECRWCQYIFDSSRNHCILLLYYVSHTMSAWWTAINYLIILLCFIYYNSISIVVGCQWQCSPNKCVWLQSIEQQTISSYTCLRLLLLRYIANGGAAHILCDSSAAVFGWALLRCEMQQVHVYKVIHYKFIYKFVTSFIVNCSDGPFTRETDLTLNAVALTW